MASAQVVLRGRFSPGSPVRLVKVPSEATLRAEGGDVVGEATVDEKGEVRFSSGVDVGARYFVTGLIDGSPVEVRARGRAADDPDPVLSQAPIDRDRGFFAGLLDENGGRLGVDAVPPRVDLPELEAAPNLSQQQVDPGSPQRSATPIGSAHPFDPEEQAPYPRQESLPAGTRQMSDTRTDREGAEGVAGGGMATPLAVGPQRQEDVGDGVWQRSSTPTGVATVIPNPPEDAQVEKESSEGKAMRGQPVRVSSEPLGGKPVKGASPKQSEKRQRQVEADTREALDAPAEVDAPPEGGANTSGLDAQGQPVDPGVARGAGVESADKPAEPVRQRRK